MENKVLASTHHTFVQVGDIKIATIINVAPHSVHLARPRQ